MQQPKAYTVTAITRMIKNVLEESFQGIWVEGEISNYIHHTSGHRYFSLKDDNAVLKGVMWRSLGNGLKFEPKNGQKVLAFGDIAVYEKGGQYQLNCRKIVPVGIGPLELAYRQLYEKLSAEGLFAAERKQPLPRFAQKIGIVTSPTGAAIRDIVQIARRRNRSVELILYPAQVQGEGAEATIAAGIRYFNTRADIDVLIVGRGGGSLEDLWPFNTETTVRAIAGSRIPVISAVGHEIDFMLADYAADMRAPTPSAAAELAVWPAEEMRRLVRQLVVRQATLLGGQVREARRRLAGSLSRPVLARPMEMVFHRQQRLDHAAERLATAGKNSFEKYRNRLSLVVTRMDALSPLAILARGYSVTRRLPGQTIVRSAGETAPGDRLETLVVDGEIISVVQECRRKQDDEQEEA